ncbi:hypothetical protein [Streptomyces sp. NPDC088925]|uniref:hypothetical protein n=1 Tax=Streptomyces sp. NPDC088925 TaxID=3365914 RepID=UPI003830742A
MKDFTEDLHRAVAGVFQEHGYGMLSRLVMCAEVVDEEDGDIGLLIGSSPENMPVWDRAGMMRYALADVDADTVRQRIDMDEGDEE